MKKISLIVLLLIVASLVVACSSSESPGEQPQQPPAQQPTLPTQTTPPAPAGNCQSRLDGKVVNTATNQSPANVTVEIASASFKAKTFTDNNGLYGFFGLCAGEYTISITPPNSKTAQSGPKVTLDGTNKRVKFDLSYK
jgi:ABC-type oligopeptide transport system substrate-binding subunit